VARVLLAWEFGGDLGHMTRVLAVARELRDRGHEPLLAFADLGALGALDASGLPAVAAPLLARPRDPDPSPLSAADILLNLGFADPAGLAGALAAWGALLRLFEPGLVVADYAPTALLAARAARLPRVALGSGFSDPPRGHPMPSLRHWIPADAAILAQRDARLVRAVREALARAAPRAAPVDRAEQVFEADAHLVCSWPMLDPFGARGDVEYLGPQGEASRATTVSWRFPARPRAFAYLKPRDPRFGAVLQALRASEGEAVVAAPGLDAKQAAALSSEQVRIVPGPVSLSILAQADLCVSHGGPGIASAAIGHGVAQALLPGQLEQFMVAQRLAEAGLARTLDPEAPAEAVGAFIAQALKDTALREAAARERDASRPAGSAAARIAAMMES
jgi:UDP:flavonoid glycosyltransferase YjiC (YdhE family)